jgi:hypothetical protein
MQFLASGRRREKKLASRSERRSVQRSAAGNRAARPVGHSRARRAPDMPPAGRVGLLCGACAGRSPRVAGRLRKA